LVSTGIGGGPWGSPEGQERTVSRKGAKGRGWGESIRKGLNPPETKPTTVATAKQRGGLRRSRAGWREKVGGRYIFGNRRGSEGHKDDLFQTFFSAEARRCYKGVGGREEHRKTCKEEGTRRGEHQRP